MNDATDLPDVTPGDGVCNTSNAANPSPNPTPTATPTPTPPSTCTLRAAIQEANALALLDAANTFTIVLVAGTTYTLTIGGNGEDNAATGDLDVKANITITGNGATVHGIVLQASWDRVFDVFGGYTVAFNNFTIRDGYATNGPGGGIRHNGGTSGTLTLTGMTVEDNDTGQVDTDPDGAAIYNGPGLTLVITGSTVKDNGFKGGNVPGNGGGIYNVGTLTLTGSVVSGNLGANGGGLYNVGQADISGSTFATNTANSPGSSSFIGGNGGGIYNVGVLTLNNSRILGNSAAAGGGLYNEGVTAIPASAGISAIAIVTIVGTDIINNNATVFGGGIANFVDNAVNDSVVQMSGGSLRNNIASGFLFPFSGAFYIGGTGGGIANIGTIALVGVTVDGNSAADFGTGQFAAGNGGGIYNIGVFTVSESALINNFVSGSGVGGAVSNGDEGRFFGPGSNGTPQAARISAIGTSFAATNVTISGNSAPGGGGAIANKDDSTATLNSVTVVNNSSGLLTVPAPLTEVRALATTTSVQNSIVAGNTEYNCSGTLFTDGGYNIDSANTCAFTAAGSQINIANPQLGPLTINAPGTTATHALLVGSPAIDKIPATGAGCLATDQRGVTRPQGATCDIGAYEVIAVAASPSPSSSPAPATFTTVLTITGGGGVNPGAGSYTSPAGSTQTYAATPNSGSILLGWTIDGIFAGFGNPLALPVTKNRTVVAAFAPIPQFCDVNTGTPNYTAIVNLAARGIILGSDNPTPGGVAKCFVPDGPLLRIHVAGMVARAFGWDKEDHGNSFIDKGSVDDDLWRNAGTLAFYNVARGYQDGTFDPTGPVLHVQAVSFVTRAMIRSEYWTLLEDKPAYYTALPPASGHRQDAVTYFANAGNIPGTSAPTDTWGGPAGYNGPSTRTYFAQVLWQAYSSYFSTNRIPQ